MKPFNLAEALAGKPVVNGRGESVVDFTHYTTLDTMYPVYAVVKSREGDDVRTFTVGGQYQRVPGLGDLFMADPIERRTGYINVWQDSELLYPVANFHYSLVQAIAERTSSCYGKKKVLLARLPFDYTFNQDTKEIKINA